MMMMMWNRKNVLKRFYQNKNCAFNIFRFSHHMQTNLNINYKYCSQLPIEYFFRIQIASFLIFFHIAYNKQMKKKKQQKPAKINKQNKTRRDEKNARQTVNAYRNLIRRFDLLKKRSQLIFRCHHFCWCS